MRFSEAYDGYEAKRLIQSEAASLLGICSRTFRRYICRYEAEGFDGLNDKRLTQASFRRAPVDEVISLVVQYKLKHFGWNARHFYSWYKRDGGSRSYSWVKNTLQSHHLVAKRVKQGVHRCRRAPSPIPGMMLLQDGSTHEWVPFKKWDLILTMDVMRQTSIIPCFLLIKKAQIAAYRVFVMLSRRKVFLAPFIPIEAVIIGSHHLQAAL